MPTINISSFIEDNMLSLFDGGLERVLEEIMGEPVSLKIRSDLYCNSTPGLPASLPSSFSSPVSSEPQAPPHLSSLSSPLVSTSISSTEQQIFPPPPTAHKSAPSTCFPPPSNSNIHTPFPLHVPTPHRNVFPVAHTKSSHFTTESAYSYIPVTSSVQPEQQGSPESIFYSGIQKNSTIVNNNISNSLGIGNHSNRLACDLQTQNYAYRNNLEPISDFTCYNATDKSVLQSNVNTTHLQSKSNFVNLGDQVFKSPNDIPMLEHTRPSSSCLPPALIHSKSLAGGRPVSMPPVEAMQVPKESTYNPSSPPMNISSSVVPTKKFSANIETFTQSDSSVFTNSSNCSSQTTTIETTSNCPITTNSSPKFMVSSGNQQQHLQRTLPRAVTDTSPIEASQYYKSCTEASTGNEEGICCVKNLEKPFYSEDPKDNIPCPEIRREWGRSESCTTCPDILITETSSSSATTIADSVKSSYDIPVSAPLYPGSTMPSSTVWPSTTDHAINPNDITTNNEGNYRTTMSGISSEVQTSIESNVQKHSLRTFHSVQSLQSRAEGETSDIIDVVSIREGTGQSNVTSMDDCDNRDIKAELQQKLEDRLSQHYPMTQSQRNIMLGQHMISKSYHKQLSSQENNNNVSESVRTPTTNETLDLSTRPKAHISPRPMSPSRSTFVPIHIAPAHPSCDNSKMSQIPTPSRVHCPPNQAYRGGANTTLLNSGVRGDRAETLRTELGLPPTNLPPHILAWLLSSHLNPLQRAQLSSVGSPSPHSLLGGLGSLYIPSPAASPDDPLDVKPLDLSSKSLSTEATVSWMTPDARCGHHTIGHRATLAHEAMLINNLNAAGFNKSESPAAESGSTDDGSIVGLSKLSGLGSGSLLKQLGTGLGERSGLTAVPLSTEDLIARVLEAKASGRGRRRTDQSKRSYTDTELQAALRDIQSGKLGTRRAAVIYGIPRSTLRNKVYKLAIEKERAKKILEQRANDAVPLYPMPEDAAFTSSETLRALLRNKMAIKLEEITKVNPTELQYEEEELMERRQALDPALGHLLENVTSLALNSDQREMSPNVISSISLYPKLEEFTKRMIEKRYNEELAKNKPVINETTENLNEIVREHNTQNVSVPIFEGTNATVTKNESIMIDNNENSTDTCQRINRNMNPVNFKDMIVQYMGQNSGSNELKDQVPLRDDSLMNISKIAGVPNPSISMAANSNLTKDKRVAGKKRTGSPLNSGGKGSRPKRGKYRNYDRENLIKAVQAVQSGEMSVHRAGSFYGVPHSTLEYKVKERHLNRGKKKESTNPLSSVPSSSPKNIIMPSRPTMVPTNSFTLENTILSKEFQQRCNGNESTTIDLTEGMKNNNRDSIISEAYHAAKKIKLDNGEFEEANQLSGQNSNNPFNLWNSPSPILPNFMSTSYERDSFYASQMIKRFQEAASNRYGKEYSVRQTSLSPTAQHSDQGSPMLGQSSGSCSPNLEKERQGIQGENLSTKSSVLDALLRGKSPLEAAAASIHPNSPQPSVDFNASPWSVSSRLFNLSKQLTKVHEEKPENEPQPSSTSTGLAAFNALCSLPSVLGLQNTLAAALHQRVSPITELLQKDTCHLGQANSTSSTVNTQNILPPVPAQSESINNQISTSKDSNNSAYSEQHSDSCNQGPTAVVTNITSSNLVQIIPSSD